MKPIRRIAALLLTLVLMLSSVGMTASASGTLAQGVAVVTASSLRLRAEPTGNSKILTTAPAKDYVVILGKSGEWYKVNYNLQEGYMHEDYLTVSSCENVELGCGKITGNGVNLRTGPGTSHSVAAVSSRNDSCSIIGVNHGWYKVIYKDITAYIRSDYVALTEIPYENHASGNTPRFFRAGKAIAAVPGADAVKDTMSVKSQEKSTPVTITGDQIIVEAMKYLGAPYASSGASPSGFDCSGLVYYVLKQLGYDAYRTPSDQYTQGTYVAKSDLKIGDMVFFSGTSGAGGISHVGIYAGNGQFIHAPNSRSRVSYSDLTSGYWANHYHGARRIY